ncbi:hypothetical protein RJ640_012715 [Escallonia rubra]|uniref:Remorin C-terminal domain-containing protein n=1 Tax=Escallonia rubra TaxID=112253 RepID=A0AA88UKM0_9ASTE|nr:hypothetical protein RJ640_012715 [Escallonia rubra]
MEMAENTVHCRKPFSRNMCQQLPNQVKAERLKSRAQEKFTNKLAAARRIVEEKRANAEAKLNEKSMDYVEILQIVEEVNWADVEEESLGVASDD